MKKAAFLLAVVLGSLSCHKKSNSGPVLPTTPNKYLAASFPHIDTVTLWHTISGQRTGAKATITSAGVMVITGYAGSRGNYAGGTYLMKLPDTSVVSSFVGFQLYQYGPDSVISKLNYIRRIETTGWQRAYYQAR